MLSHYLLLIIIIIPLLEAGVGNIFHDSKLRNIFNLSLIICLLTQVAKLVILFTQSASNNFALSLITIAPKLEIAFNVEPLGLIFASMCALLWLVTSIYSMDYIKLNYSQGYNKFFSFISLAIFATLGISFSANLFTMFIFYELLTLLTYPLVIFNLGRGAKYDDQKIIKAGRLYLGILLSSSILFFLPAIVITYVQAGTLTFTTGGILPSSLEKSLLIILLLLYLFGIAKSAIMPLHRWLVESMVAPAPVSALLHAVAIVKAGVFCLIKIVVYIFGISYLKNLIALEPNYINLITYIAAFTILMGSILALRQTNLKLMLAYSTISQLGTIIITLFIISPIAVTGAVFQMIAHSFAKITLFFVAGAIATRLHKEKISEMVGVGRIMPFTMLAFSLAAFSIIALPASIGFVGKYYMTEAALSTNNYFIIAVLSLSSMLSCCYFIPIIFRAYYYAPHNEQNSEGRPAKLISLAIGATTILTIVPFFAPNLLKALESLLLYRSNLASSLDSLYSIDKISFPLFLLTIALAIFLPIIIFLKKNVNLYIVYNIASILKLWLRQNTSRALLLLKKDNNLVLGRVVFIVLVALVVGLLVLR